MLGSNDALTNLLKNFTLKFTLNLLIFLKHAYISAVSHGSYLNRFDILIWKKQLVSKYFTSNPSEPL